MTVKKPNILQKNKNILVIAVGVAAILMLPLIAMQFTDEVAWGPVDFIAAGVLLFGTGLAFELLARKSGSLSYRAAAGVALAAALMLVWVNLAVGVIGSEDNPANWMYIGVLAIGLIGSLAARFQPRGMSRAMFATALAQAVVPLMAMIFGMLPMTSPEEVSYALRVLAANAFFVVLWIGSALLFRRAAASQS